MTYLRFNRSVILEQQYHKIASRGKETVIVAKFSF